MRDKYGNGQKTKVMESASCTEEYGNAEGEPEDDYLSLIHSGKACIGAPIYFFFELGTDRLLNRSQLVNLDEVARIAKKYGLKVKVIGAADSATGSEAINDNLSRSRARFIAEELMKRGMEMAPSLRFSMAALTITRPMRRTAIPESCCIYSQTYSSEQEH